MPDDAKWSRFVRLLDLIGIVIALAALGTIVRYALLLNQAWGGHPRLIG